ncbi:DNA primase [Maritimibacter sp. 55A14]|uniref:DNA primase n=1 Tax=Maritimibacter sp. 55A14 TaxID=2174844 RepID=UPI000D608438|nr:DNA primase [Maritimibacter sp. 55A14]PWE33278.1 DNA primase [Maritimibacter sp. 55A14]
MSLPPGFLDELRSRTSISQVAGRKVIWDTRKSNQAKGDMWAPCPFHQEKTASFHVDDRKGFYYCFGCNAKGDAISFVQETENVGFMEAIEILAREAGMEMPARDPQAREKIDRNARLIGVMEDAARFYRTQLQTAAAAEARDYLTRRGLKPETLERFGIGFAPDARQALWSHLTGKGVAADLVIDAGLAARPDDGGAPYDRFRGRIVFPIRDARGRCIAFGGRAMSEATRAKYLNSPETALFDKGRTLYNHGPAREAAGKGQPLIVTEGYMDVIALCEAGLEAAVAPLGTAITEDQLKLMWRIAPEPVIALDGDSAGLRAAHRVIDLALPLLEAGQSLRFALLPEGQDPDDLIRAEGAGAMRRLVETAQPMVRLLWSRETEGRVFDSPERRAALDAALKAVIGRIRDGSIRTHYFEEVKRLRAELFAAPRRGTQPGGGWQQGKGGRWTRRTPPAQPMPMTRDSLLGRDGPGAVAERLREAVILATLVTHPALLETFEGELEALECQAPEHRALQQALLRHAGLTDPEALREKISGALCADALEKLMALSHVQIAPAIRNPQDRELAMMALAEDLARLKATRGARREIDEALEDAAAMSDEKLTWRLGQAAEAVNRAQRSNTDDRAEYDIAPSGARIDRGEREALDALLGTIDLGRAGSKE